MPSTQVTGLTFPDGSRVQNSPAREGFSRSRKTHWDQVAQTLELPRRWSRYYHRRLAAVYGTLVQPGARVLELGSGTGDLLAALAPSVGVGVDFSPEMVRRARERHPHLRFMEADAHEVALDEPFDAVILSDLVNDLWDVQTVFERVWAVSGPGTRIIVNTQSRLWEPPLAAVEKLGLARPVLRRNWLTREDTRNLAHLAGLEVIRTWQELLWPVGTPLLAPLANRVLVKMWPMRHLALSNFLLLRRAPAPAENRPPVVSVIVPARNESGNVANILDRIPEMGAGTEIVFVEGHSRDDTYAEIQRQVAMRPERKCVVLRQPGIGKGDAVRAGFAAATGDVFMILDADLTVSPELLPRFLDALQSGRGEFINGVRLVYPMADEAMRFLNLIGNKFFSLAFSWLLGQPIKDTLCGTKVLSRRDYERIAAGRTHFGDFDPFGDFDLLFGAARLGLRIVDLPVRYAERTYGTTNIDRWRHGALLFRMVAVAAARLKFV